MKEESQNSAPPAAEHFTQSLSEWKGSRPSSRAHLRALKELETDMPTEDPYGAMEPPNLFLVRVENVEKFLLGRDVTLVPWVLALVEVFNFYATMGKVRTGICRKRRPSPSLHHRIG